MIPDIEPDSEWTARSIAERWVEYIPELLPPGIRDITVSNYSSERYKVRKAVSYISNLIEKELLKETEGEPIDRKITRDWVENHPLFGSVPGQTTKTVTYIPAFVLGKDLWSYERSELKAQNHEDVPLLNLSGKPDKQKEWMLEYVEEHGLDISRELTDEELADFLKEAEQVGMTENSFSSRRRELKIRGINRDKKANNL
ncbi:MAG: hypothetical protein JG718_07620 [Candidatus Thiothrix moscowensis]|nr:hypothetical protein [Candidatus Thiothrix moscowensis]